MFCGSVSGSFIYSNWMAVIKDIVSGKTFAALVRDYRNQIWTWLGTCAWCANPALRVAGVCAVELDCVSLAVRSHFFPIDSIVIAIISDCCVDWNSMQGCLEKSQYFFVSVCYTCFSTDVQIRPNFCGVQCLPFKTNNIWILRLVFECQIYTRCKVLLSLLLIRSSALWSEKLPIDLLFQFHTNCLHRNFRFLSFVAKRYNRTFLYVLYYQQRQF